MNLTDDSSGLRTAPPAEHEAAPPSGPGRTFRVLHSAFEWLPRTQTWMFNQARALPENFESHIVCETTNNLEEFGLSHMHCLADGTRFRYGWDKLVRALGWRHYLGHLPQVARQIESDVLHSHFGHIGWMNLKAARQMRGGHVVTFYGQDLTYLPRVEPKWVKRYREMFASVDAVLCEGPHMAEKVAELGCPRERVMVHHLGVDVGSIHFEPRASDTGEPLRVLMAGSFTEKKGIPDGLKALGQIKDDVDFRVTLIGDANAEPRNLAEKRRIQVEIDEFDLRDRVEMPGYQSYGQLMQAAYTHDVFLSPSVHAEDGDTEGGAPVTILEMAATGMPIVSTRHCDIPSVVVEGESALLADEHDVDALAEHLRTIDADRDAWSTMAIAGRRHVEKEYDMYRQGEKLAAIYRSL